MRTGYVILIYSISLYETQHHQRTTTQEEIALLLSSHVAISLKIIIAVLMLGMDKVGSPHPPTPPSPPHYLSLFLPLPPPFTVRQMELSWNWRAKGPATRDEKLGSII